jgi:hypothetical protein
MDLLNTNIDGYILITSYCRTQYMWGGIALFAKQSLYPNIEVLPMNEAYIPTEQTFETLAVKIKSKTGNLILIGTYRSPDVRTEEVFLDKLGYLLQQYSRTLNRIVILGDANFNIRESDTPSIKNLQNTLTEHGCRICYIPATRITPTTISSIDGCYTNIKQGEIDVMAYTTSLSDHHMVICKIKNMDKDQKATYKFSRNFSKKKLNELKERLSRED